MTYIFPTYLAVSVSKVTVMNTHRNQATSFFSTSFFSLFCFLDVMNFNVYTSKSPTVMSGHSIRSIEMNTTSAVLLTAVFVYQKLSLREWEKCSLVFSIWLGFGWSHIERFQSQTLTLVSSVFMGNHQICLWHCNGKYQFLPVHWILQDLWDSNQFLLLVSTMPNTTEHSSRSARITVLQTLWIIGNSQ